MLFIPHKLQAYFLKITSGRWPPFTSMHCCKRVWKLPYTRLRRSSSIAATSSTMACLSSWIVMIRLRNTRSFRNCHRNPHRKKSGMAVVHEVFGTVISRFGDIAWPARSPDLTVPDFFLWGFLKDRVFRRRIMTIQELKQAILTKLRLLMRTYGGACTATSRHACNNALM